MHKVHLPIILERGSGSMVAGQLGLKSNRPLSQLGPSQLGPVYFQNVHGVCFVFCTCILTQTKSKIKIKQLQLSSLSNWWGVNLLLDCHEPGYQMKVFTLCQSLTPMSFKQGNYRFLTIELVKTAIDQSKV